MLASELGMAFVTPSSKMFPVKQRLIFKHIGDGF